MPDARLRHSAAAIGTKLYIIGGRSGADALVTTVTVFDTAAGTWSTSTTTLTALQSTSDACSWTMGLDIYVAGGYTATYTAKADVMKWSPTTGATTFVAAASLAEKRGDCVAVVRHDHTTAWVIGGYTSDDWTQAVSHVEAFDVTAGTTGAWTTKASTSSPRGDKAAVFFNDAIYAIGGEKKDGATTVVHDTIEAYDAVSNTWTEITTSKLPSPRFRYAAAQYGGSVYVFGGQTTAVGTGTAAVNPVTNTVYAIGSTYACPAPGTSAPTASAGASAAVAGQHASAGLVVIGAALAAVAALMA